MYNKKILVFAPHPDDEILGLGAYLYSMIGDYKAKVHIVFATTDGTPERWNELKSVMSELGVVGYSVLYSGMDGRLNEVPTSKLVGAIDEEIYSVEPDEVFVCYPSHHQDHKVLYEAVMAACRLKQFFMPSMVALYEYGFVFNNPERIPGGKMYFPMSKRDLTVKQSLFALYSSQNKPKPSLLNADGIETLARVRGMECGCDYAECFYIQKMVLK